VGAVGGRSSYTFPEVAVAVCEVSPGQEMVRVLDGCAASAAPALGCPVAGLQRPTAAWESASAAVVCRGMSHPVVWTQKGLAWVLGGVPASGGSPSTTPDTVLGLLRHTTQRQRFLGHARKLRRLTWACV
jgi:hypothetical protein